MPAIPNLREIKRALLTRGAEFALLSGSGATVFGLFDEESTARRAEAELAQDAELKSLCRSNVFRPAQDVIGYAPWKPHSVDKLP